MITAIGADPRLYSNVRELVLQIQEEKLDGPKPFSYEDSKKFQELVSIGEPAIDILLRGMTADVWWSGQGISPFGFNYAWDITNDALGSIARNLGLEPATIPEKDRIPNRRYTDYWTDWNQARTKAGVEQESRPDSEITDSLPNLSLFEISEPVA